MRKYPMSSLSAASSAQPEQKGQTPQAILDKVTEDLILPVEVYERSFLEYEKSYSLLPKEDCSQLAFYNFISNLCAF